MKKKLVVTLLSVFGLTFGQFKFGISPIGVSAIVNKDYNMARHGVGGFLEFAGLFKENYEVGVQIGYSYYFSPSKQKFKIDVDQFLANPAGLLSAQEMFGNVTAISTKSMSNLNLYALPYFRYYFLPNPNLRPYLLVGVGIAYNMANAGTEGTASQKLATYAGTSVSAKLGVGIRLLKFLEVGLSYGYAGKMTYEKNNDLFNSASQEYQQGIQYLKPTLKQVYNLHTLLLHVSITLGGNIKKN